MDILDYAMKMEQEGEVYYLEQAQKIADPNVVRFLNLLAQAERKHYAIFKSYKEGLAVEIDNQFVQDVKTIFQQMKDSGQSFATQSGAADIVAVLTHGLEIENKTITYYAQQMGQTEDDNLKRILLDLKREEAKHYSILSDLIDYYLKPDLWNEQAEFTHLQPY
jgi:rubrerythrin